MHTYITEVLKGLIRIQPTISQLMLCDFTFFSYSYHLLNVSDRARYI
jgi:hypothetical protein